MRITGAVLAGVMILATSAVPAAAQGVGIKGGMNFARFSVDPEESGVSFPYNAGPTGGIFVAAGSGAVGIQVEALFSRKGSKVEEGGSEARIMLDYVDIPLLLRFNGVPANDTTIFATLGPTIGVNIRARQEDPDGTEQDIQDEIEQIEYGVTAGLGVQAGHITLEGRYTYGLSELDAMPDGDRKIRHRMFSVFLGFVF